MGHARVGDARHERQDAQRDDGPRQQADRRRGDEQRIDADLAAHRTGERRAEGAQLPDPDAGDDQQRDVKTGALHHPAAGLATTPRAQRDEGSALQQRRQREGERARGGGGGGHHLGKRA